MDPIGVLTIIAAGVGNEVTETRGNGQTKHFQPRRG
jgi:hypothetical protein